MFYFYSIVLNRVKGLKLTIECGGGIIANWIRVPSLATTTATLDGHDNIGYYDKKPQQQQEYLPTTTINQRIILSMVFWWRTHINTLSIHINTHSSVASFTGSGTK